nr:MAG TPA: peptidase [Bacteriophage sp.]
MDKKELIPNISEHITYKEATASNKAKQLGISNTPNEKELRAMKLLADKVFEPLRKWYGKPIQVTSFFRSAKINKAIGGVQKGNSVSQHTTGQAADIDTVSDNKKLFDYIKDNLPFDQLIWEYGNDANPDWIHVSYSEIRNRKQVLRAVKSGGRTVYLPYK